MTLMIYVLESLSYSIAGFALGLMLSWGLRDAL